MSEPPRGEVSAQTGVFAPSVPYHALTRFPLTSPQTHVAVGAVVLATLDLVQGGVREVQLLRAVVDGQAVGRADVLLDEGQDVGAGERCPHDAWVELVPVGPEHQADGRGQRHQEPEGLPGHGPTSETTDSNPACAPQPGSHRANSLSAGKSPATAHSVAPVHG